MTIVQGFWQLAGNLCKSTTSGNKNAREACKNKEAGAVMETVAVND